MPLSISDPAEPVLSRRELNKAATRQAITDAALSLLRSSGPGNFTVEDIADAAGILSGSLYHHFDSKESMVDEILHQFLDDLPFGQGGPSRAGW